MRSGSAKLRPRARIIGLIGDELISDEPVAVVELVKNSYDADANSVTVSFEGNPLSPSRIVIADDGTGMDLETVLGSWLEPGTVGKKQKDRSPGKRPYLGAKGIGRFASARLGQRLLLETQKKGSSEEIIVCLDWGDFTSDETYLENVEVEYEVRKSAPNRHGTKLTIEGLKKKWTSDDCEQLHSRLSRLISPFDEVNDFQIILDIPSRKDLFGVVEPPSLLLRPKYQLTGTLDSNGKFSGTVKVDGKISKAFTERQVAPTGQRPKCGPLELDIRAWDRDKDGLEPIIKKEGLTLAQIRATLNTYCGVSIYRDGFRVHPYGETGNDWLNLDLRSRQLPVRNLANNQIIGAIRISRDANPGLQDRSTREGMIKNEEHTELEEWFIRTLLLLEEIRYGVRPRRKTAMQTQPLFEAFDLKETVKAAAEALGTQHSVVKLLHGAEKQIADGAEKLQDVLSHLVMSAGLGHMVDIVIHEVGAPLGKINRQLTILERELRKHLSAEALETTSPMIESMRGWLEQIHALRERLDPQSAAKRTRATKFDATNELKLTFDLYSALISKQKIKYKISAPREPVEVKMPRAVLSQVLANLIDNAVYWLTHKKGIGNGGEIHAQISAVPKGFIVRISDDGPGIDEENREQIFEPYYSTKPNGVGLGLYIGRLVIEPYGRLLLVDKGKLSGACFEARFEKGVGL